MLREGRIYSDHSLNRISMIRTLLTLGSIVAVIALAIVAVTLYERDATELPAPVADKTYRNDAHGYEVTYPGTLDILEYTPDMATIGRLTDGGIDGVVDVRVAVIIGEPGESFIEAAVRNLANLCAADGPDASFSCTGVERSAPFVSRAGAIGYEAYLTGELKTLSTGMIQTVSKGPYYAFLIEGDAGASKILVVHAPLNQNADEADTEAIRAVAQSVVISEPQGDAGVVERYVAENISRLSPEPEVLGGTYYVTAIEVTDGSGTVSYEDGHNAHTADFTYTQKADGSVSIDSFVIRPQ